MTPAARPGARFLTAEWRWLAMLNYRIDPAALAAWVPGGTEPDGWNGHTFVSVVGFRFLNTRVLGVPIPFHRDFDEINLRFYVRRRVPEGWRRGVVFVREIVPRRAIAAVARACYNERYVALPMRSRVRAPGADGGMGEVRYAWRAGEVEHFLRCTFGGAAARPVAGSEEEFITEHYWGYATQRDGGTVEYRVEHPSWRVWRAGAAEAGPRVGEFYGGPFREALAGEPCSAFVAEGSPVVVRRGRRIGPSAVPAAGA